MRTNVGAILILSGTILLGAESISYAILAATRNQYLSFAPILGFCGVVLGLLGFVLVGIGLLGGRNDREA